MRFSLLFCAACAVLPLSFTSSASASENPTALLILDANKEISERFAEILNSPVEPTGRVYHVPAADEITLAQWNHMFDTDKRLPAMQDICASMQMPQFVAFLHSIIPCENRTANKLDDSTVALMQELEKDLRDNDNDRLELFAVESLLQKKGLWAVRVLPAVAKSRIYTALTSELTTPLTSPQDYAHLARYLYYIPTHKLQSKLQDRFLAVKNTIQDAILSEVVKLQHVKVDINVIDYEYHLDIGSYSLNIHDIQPSVSLWNAISFYAKKLDVQTRRQTIESLFLSSKRKAHIIKLYLALLSGDARDIFKYIGGDKLTELTNRIVRSKMEVDFIDPMDHVQRIINAIQHIQIISAEPLCCLSLAVACDIFDFKDSISVAMKRYMLGAPKEHVLSNLTYVWSTLTENLFYDAKILKRFRNDEWIGQIINAAKNSKYKILRGKKYEVAQACGAGLLALRNKYQQ